ncbi:recombinase family protein [Mycobacterium asiaticum]|uniref:recombinase family protein n=1 Tax=Mycobacterium asiaticum TaxID=1790 RepID=UPI00055F214C|nr:recombinase family protein [Mycobacterium asiaticum]ORA12608.1 serine recombinase [Mycobacterium asiaticum DSM 44297]
MSVVQAENGVVRAGCYCRISSDPKDRREGVERQREDTIALCEVKGWTPVGYYVDNDRSASNGKDRPEWDRLLADVQAGKIDAIAAWDQDRGWRMMHELEQLRRFFTALGRRVLLATTGQGDIDLYSPTGVLAAQIKTAVSEHEIAMMKVRMRRAARQRAEQGIPKWTRAFGYLRDTHQPDPVTAPLVRQAYAAVLAGSSLREVARLFNEAGTYGLNGKPWTPSTVSLFLRKSRNAGLRAHNNEIVGKGTWPALVDESTWRAAQAVLDAPGRKPGRKSVRQHLLTGVMRCGKPGCAGYLSGQWVMQKTGGKPGRPKAGQKKEPHSGQVAHSITYACKQCRGCSVRAEHVEPLLIGLVAGRLAKPDAVDLLKAEVHDEAEAERLRLEKNTLYSELDKLAVERANGLLTGRQVQIATEVVQQQIDAIECKEQDTERLRVFDGIPLGTLEAAAAVKQLSPDRLRAVMDVLMTVTVAPTGKGGHVFNPERVQVNWR